MDLMTTIQTAMDPRKSPTVVGDILGAVLQPLTDLHAGFRQKIEDRRQKTEDRRQKTEDRRQNVEDRRQNVEDRRQKIECRRQKIEERRLKIENRQREKKRKDRMEHGVEGWQVYIV